MIEIGTNLVDWFPQTKFILPALTPKIITRPRLLETLHTAVSSHRLTLISAPAGAGKTTLLTTLPQALPGLPLSWLSLDEEDNDPAWFLGGLARALSRLNPKIGELAQPQLANSVTGEVEGRRFVGVLVNDIIQNQGQPFGLVLDDLHWVTNPIVYSLLDYLLERLPPQMHLIIATRYDPPLALARLRVRRQLAEVRLDQLRFDADELARFFKQRLNMQLSDTDLERLLQQTGGWVAGLGLIESSLSAGEYTSEGHRAIFPSNLKQAEQHIFEYLAEEIFSRQSLIEQTFLLETSILSELNVTLCEAVTGREDAGKLLEKLYRKNLFLTLTDKNTQTYRYHDLFSQFLQHKLTQQMPEALPILHKCAAHAYSETLPSLAVRHYLAARMWEEAAVAIEQLGAALLRQGMLVTMQRWIEALPAGVTANHPRLNYYLGFYGLQQGDLRNAQQRLELARQGFEAAGQRPQLGETLVYLAVCAFYQMQFDEADRYRDAALQMPLAPRFQILLTLSQGSRVGLGLDVDAYAEEFKKTLKLILDVDDPEIYYLSLLQLQPPYAFIPGVLSHFEEYWEAVIARFAGKDNYLEASAMVQASYINLLRGNREKCASFFEQARKLTRPQDVVGFMILNFFISEIGFRQWQDDYSGLDQQLADYLNRIEQWPITRPWLAGFFTRSAHISYIQGKMEKVRQLYQRAVELTYPQERPEILTSRKVMEGLIKLDEADYTRAEQLLLQALALQQQQPLSYISTSVHFWLAHLYHTQQRDRLAAETLGQLLLKCRQEGMPGLILREGPYPAVALLRLAIAQGVEPEYAARLLQLFGSDPEALPVQPSQTVAPVYTTPSGETLTPREIEVLKLLAAGATNPEIAAQLVISNYTVKVHVARILAKLEARSRTEAASRARELHLL